MRRSSEIQWVPLTVIQAVQALLMSVSYDKVKEQFRI